jgi:hypothetical protein
MSEASYRQLVRDGLEAALASALPALKERLKTLSPASRELGAQCAEGIQACLRDQAEVPVPDPDIQASIARLIFGHGDPQLVDALKTYVETIHACLEEFRNQTHPQGTTRFPF